jgi:hypothetical protein
VVDPAEQPKRVTVEEAADILGISQGAVRNRISRSTLQSVREGGRVFVLLPADRSRDTRRPTTGLQSGDSALTSALEARIESLERQLEAERQAHSESRRIIAGLVERVPQLEAPSEPRESPVLKTERDSPTPQEPPRPWWRRVFGG